MRDVAQWLSNQTFLITASLFLMVIIFISISFGRKLRQLIYYRQVDVVGELNQTYQSLLDEPLIECSQSVTFVSLRTYLLDQAPAVYQGDVHSSADALKFVKDSTCYSIPKEHIHAFLYHLYLMHTYIKKRRVMTPKVKLLIENEDAFLLFNLLERNQWDQLTDVCQKDQLAPLVYLAVMRVIRDWDSLNVESQVALQVIMKDYGRGGFEKLAIYLPKGEQHLFKKLAKRLR
ncbi:hypothetical protein GCM10012290_07110 [Halolactibacillus alkaliphilus]|uniref:Uncharacterized protein n=1 Tax=Halolactibacillus alkaliphilus TaxID=442899 RepID=A0A511WZK9_9BACI|nr:hypothetical protein [Halolactibacillus alkaliphilus]GEN56135.1 hypothetical protein HAL01_05990 [Halolactibacillus alkaliphilus]GGN66975.1 hypothetical protein GCM10012290_07110 [Halolactibacillus alkaliphilus]